jgi:diacylglycerol kinase family enzyme
MAAAPIAELERLTESLGPPGAAPKKRMLVIVNPYAATVSDRLKNLVVYALQGRYEVEAIDTQAKAHATDLCREAAHEGYDVVVAFGGDGTVNEAANGLAGSPTPLTCLPGGSTNVLCRTMGIPADVVDATEHLLRMADDWRPRRIALARVNDRHFVFSSGVGLDASVVERVDSHPRLKRRLNEWYFTYAAITTFTRYVVNPPRIVARLAGEEVRGVTAVVQRSDPYTYFNARPIHLADGASLDDDTFAAVVLERANPLDMPTILWRAFARGAPMARHRRVRGFSDLPGLRIASEDGRAFPLQVDGDYIGEFDVAEYSVRPDGLSLVS